MILSYKPNKYNLSQQSLIRAAVNLPMVVCQKYVNQKYVNQIHVEWKHLILFKQTYMCEVSWVETNIQPSVKKKRRFFSLLQPHQLSLTQVFCFIKTIAVFLVTKLWGNYEQISFIKYH